MQVEAKENKTMSTNNMGKLYDDKQTPGNASVARTAHQLNDRSNGKPLRVLSEEQWSFWINNGYVVIPDAVPAESSHPMNHIQLCQLHTHLHQPKQDQKQWLFYQSKEKEKEKNLCSVYNPFPMQV